MDQQAISNLALGLFGSNEKHLKQQQVRKSLVGNDYASEIT
jgi:hypothetical protein